MIINLVHYYTMGNFKILQNTFAKNYLFPGFSHDRHLIMLDIT